MYTRGPATSFSTSKSRLPQKEHASFLSRLNMALLPSRHFRPKIVDRLDEAFVERHLRLPVEEGASAGDVGLADPWVVGRKRSVDDFAFRAGHLDDRLRDLLN